MQEDVVVPLYESITPSRSDCTYTSCYCEENVWKLCSHIKSERPALLEEVYAVFISNERRTVPLWKQKSASGDEPVIWDYHVILLHASGQAGRSLVYDLDSRLAFPCDFLLYASQALRSDQRILPAFWRKFRVVPAHHFLSTFASDRSHMKDADGSWRMPPPPYTCIETPESTMNLDDFICMDPGVGEGQVLSLTQFIHTFSNMA